MLKYCFIITCLLTISSCSEKTGSINNASNMLPTYTDDFENDLENWIIEGKPKSAGIKKGALDIDTDSGITIWYRKTMKAPLEITYDVTVISNNGPNDRVSDLNCFWLASDPINKSDFFKRSTERNGTFKNYDYLSLYYVGLGGHSNTKTRFRKYDGKGNKPLLPEHDLSDPKFLITPNTINSIKIRVQDDLIQYFRNDELIFKWKDSNALSKGYFGFRTVRNHMKIDNFKVYELED